MVTIEQKLINQIPCLEVINEQLKNEKLPLVIFYHGFESTNDRNVQYAYLLAERGFRVVLPEIIHHGSRNPLSSKKELNLSFWNIIFTTIDEMEKIKEHYDKENLLKIEKIFVAGTSMGAMIMYGALVKYPWITAGASFMGMPSFTLFAEHLLSTVDTSLITKEIKEQLIEECKKRDITNHIDALNNRPLFIWHGRQDQTVPITLVETFYQTIEPLYKTKKELQFIVDEKAGHFVPNNGVYSFVNWMNEHN